MSLNLIQKLVELRKKVPYIQKEQKQYIKFSIVSSENVLKAFNENINNLGLILKTEVLSKTVEATEIGKTTKDKTIFNYLVSLDMLYTWVNADNPDEREEIRFAAIANDENSSYAYGQALTYAEKTFFLKEFNIATDDVDPDIFQKEVLKRIPITKEQIVGVNSQLDKLEELTGNPRSAFLEQAKISNQVPDKRTLEEFTGYDFGLVCGTLIKWVDAYEKKAKKKDKEVSKPVKEE